MSHEHDDARDDAPDFLATLPRTAPLTPGADDRIVEQLRREGFFRRRNRALLYLGAAAAAGLIFVAGTFAGSRYAHRNSLEEMLARKDLTVAERVLLLQRAGSAYVQAAQSYADAAKQVDTTAVEVASRVLLGAAHAVARNSLDGGLSERLTRALAPADNNNRKPVIWF
jgi:hypothetical protein